MRKLRTLSVPQCVHIYTKISSMKIYVNQDVLTIKKKYLQHDRMLIEFLFTCDDEINWNQTNNYAQIRS